MNRNFSNLALSFAHFFLFLICDESRPFTTTTPRRPDDANPENRENLYLFRSFWIGGSVCCPEGIWIAVLFILDLVWPIEIAEMEEDKNKIFVNAMVNFGYKRSDVNVALARSLGNEEVNMGWLQFYRLRRQRLKNV